MRRRSARSAAQTSFRLRSTSRPAAVPLCAARVEDESSGARRRNVPVDVFPATSTPNETSRSDDGRPASVTDRPVIRPVDRTAASVPSSVASSSITPAAVAGSMLAGAPNACAWRIARRKIRRAHHDTSADRRGFPLSRVQADVGGGSEVQRTRVTRGHLDMPAVGLTRPPHVDRGRPAGRDNTGRGADAEHAGMPTALRGAIRRSPCRSSRAFPRACRSLESGVHRFLSTALRCDSDGACRPRRSCRALQPSRRQCPE